MSARCIIIILLISNPFKDCTNNKTFEKTLERIFDNDCGEITRLLQGRITSNTEFTKIFKGTGKYEFDFEQSSSLSNDMIRSLNAWNSLCKAQKSGLLTQEEFLERFDYIWTPFLVAEKKYKQIVAEQKGELELAVDQFMSVTVDSMFNTFITAENNHIFQPLVDSLHNRINSSLPSHLLNQHREIYYDELQVDIEHPHDEFISDKLNDLVSEVYSVLNTVEQGSSDSDVVYNLIDKIDQLYLSKSEVKDRALYFSSIIKLENDINDYLASIVESNKSKETVSNEINQIIETSYSSSQDEKSKVEALYQLSLKYDTNEWRLSDDKKSILIDSLSKYSSNGYSFDIVGYADRTGIATSNISLSNYRAQSIKAFVNQEMGIPIRSINSFGAGATEYYEGGLGENRRVIVYVYRI